MTASVPAGRGRSGGLWRLGLPVLGVVVAVLAWQAATSAFQVRPRSLPSPWRVAVSIRDNARHLFDEALVTLFETLAGFALGGVVGLLCAALLAASPGLDRATLPLVAALNAIPKVALAPVLAIWLGLRYEPHVALAALLCFLPILTAARAGLTSTPAELEELARSLSAPGWQKFFKIRVPWAIPQVFAGLKRGMALAVTGTVVAQLVRPSGGLGSVILLAGRREDTTLALAAVVPLTVISALLYYAVVAVERRLRWAETTTAARAHIPPQHWSGTTDRL